MFEFTPIQFTERSDPLWAAQQTRRVSDVRPNTFWPCWRYSTNLIYCYMRLFLSGLQPEIDDYLLAKPGFRSPPWILTRWCVATSNCLRLHHWNSYPRNHSCRHRNYVLSRGMTLSRSTSSIRSSRWKFQFSCTLAHAITITWPPAISYISA